MGARPDVQVAVISYNVRELLRACLESIYRCAADEGIEARVWVWDNASHDGSAGLVAAEFPQAVLCRSDVNGGYVGGTNSVLRAMGGSTVPVLLLNPDTELTPGALTTLLEDMELLPAAGVIGPGLVYGDGTPQHSAFRFPDLAQTFLDFYPLHGRLTESRLNGRYPEQEAGGWPFLCDHPLGAAMLLRPEMLREIGGMDPGYFLYCEEVDWCRRALAAGWEVWSDPRAVIVHHAGRSTTQTRRESYTRLWCSRYRYFAKHHGRAYLGAVRAVVQVGLAGERVRLEGRLRHGVIDEAQASQSRATLADVARL
ncbi:MAG: glycosyltransferase family 2 protein [Anaerolineae bacterium]|nr:glycosyltransferase family 2 protein [Anaerolineae bacterium]